MKRMIIAAMVVAMMATVSQAAVRTWDGGGGNGNWSTTANWDGDTTLPSSGSDSVELVTVPAQPYFDVAFTIGNGQYMSNLVGSLTFRISGGVLTVAEGGTLDMTGANFWQGGSPRRVVLEGGAAARANSYNASFDDWTTEFIANADGVTTFETDNAVQLAGPLKVDLTNYNTNNGLDLVLFNYGSQSGTFSTTNITGYTETNNTAVDYAYQINGAGDMGIALRLNGIQPISWDGGGSDDNWNTAENWDRDFVPAAAADVAIGSGYTVTNAPDTSPALTFKSLEIASGSSVTFDGDWFSNVDITSRGTLTTAGNLFRLYGTATLDLYGALNKAYALQGTITFHDGASQTGNLFLEGGSSPVMNFELSETGFTTINTGGTLFAYDPWANVTFNVDISQYDRTLGTTIVLMDFNGYSDQGAGAETGFTNATRNVTGHSGGTLSWDAANDRIILEVVPIKGTLVTIQ